MIHYAFVVGVLLLASDTLAGLQEVGSLNKIYDQIAESEYDIRWFDEVQSFKIANRNQGLRFTLRDEGFLVEPRVFDEAEGKPWEYEISLLGYGKDPRSQADVRGGSWTTQGRKAWSAKDRIEVEYINEKDGLRQNFLVKEKPPGNQPLELTFLVRTENLVFDVPLNANSVDFFLLDGTQVARYHDLHVFDATGAELPAVMIRKNAEQFAIVVDDANAVYPVLVDPLNVSVKVYTESQSGAKFGYSVARFNFARSFDYPGIIVGAPYFDTGLHTDAGKVFVYYAFSTLPSTPTWTKEGDQANCHFGWSVASPGDVYNDNHPDVLVGAPDYDSSGYTDNGKVFLFNCTSSGIGTTASWSAAPAVQSYAHAGYAISAIGNFDSDLYDDFAIGAPDYDYSPSSDDGMIFVYKGSSTGPSFVAQHLGNGQSRRGFSIASVGDLDGNTHDDFIVGSPNHADSGGVRRGAIQIYLSNGTSHGFPTTILGQNAGDQFGFSVAGVGDGNGDGSPDFLVGAPYFENGQTDEGKAYLYSGTSSSAYWTDESNQSNAHFGWSVTGDERPFRGDIDGDLIPDFAIGAPDFDSISYTNSGLVRFYLGGSSPSYNTAILGIFNNAQTGTSIAVLTAVYRTFGLAAGTPPDGGGTVQIWRWQP